MERRFVFFLIVSFAFLFVTSSVLQWLYPPPKKPPVAARQDAKPQVEGKKPQAEGNKPAEKPQKPLAKEEKKPEKPGPAVQAAQPEVPEQWISLGSVDNNAQKNPYRMSVTLSNKGAGLVRVELNSYFDIDHRNGYLGYLVMSPDVGGGKGCPVQIVGPGTPAAEAGLQPGDVIKQFDGQPVTGPGSLDDILGRTRPDQKVAIVVARNGQEKTLTATLRRQPLEIIRPEDNDPSSLQLTLAQVDRLKLDVEWTRDVAVARLLDNLHASEKEIADLNLDDVKPQKGQEEIRLPRTAEREESRVPISGETEKALDAWQNRRGEKPGPLFPALSPEGSEGRLSAADVRRIVAHVRANEGSDHPGQYAELEGVHLRRGTWKLVEHRPDLAVFRRTLPQWGLAIDKTYRLVKVPEESRTDSDYPAYHLQFSVEIHNQGGQARQVAYQLDGPNGLPTEGAWYASNLSRSWSGSGLRNFIVSFGATPEMVNATTVAQGKDLPHPGETAASPLTFVGVSAQYFSSVLMPERKNQADVWYDSIAPISVGKVNSERPMLANTSCRLVSAAETIKPGDTLKRPSKLFVGPKKPALLERYEEGGRENVTELVYYGWPIFAFFAKPLTAILHFFYGIVWNYGLAIILLTVLVRGCMFPISRKQALGAQKMAVIQPELKKLQEKYKNNMEARGKAQQELFKKHGYNPASGCLVAFIQLPVFMGLYRALMVDVQLRDAPLISPFIRWCSNLAGPDMLYDWSSFMPLWVNSGQGIFGLGPYFNLLPILTIILFILQQKMFMPPAADEQAAMQQKMMQYMMIFMGLLFFKVASGLCIYFIASSLWGLGERRFLPKIVHAAPADATETRAQAKARQREATKKK